MIKYFIFLLIIISSCSVYSLKFSDCTFKGETINFDNAKPDCTNTIKEDEKEGVKK